MRLPSGVRQLAERSGPMNILHVEKALPPHRYRQDEIFDAMISKWDGARINRARLDRLQQTVGVKSRHLALPLESYPEIEDFTASNDHFIEAGTDLAEDAMRRALQAAGLDATDIDAVFFVSVTGISTPSIDARLMNRLALRPDVKRTPIFGLGCVAGAAGLARVHDYLQGFPDHIVALISVELCSLTLQLNDFTPANLIAATLFGDGGACVLASGAESKVRPAGAAPSSIDTHSRFYPDTETIMGWKIGAFGFRVLLDATVPDLVNANLRRDVDGFLSGNGLCRDDIAWWVCHTGGPRVIDAIRDALGLPGEALSLTRRSLEEVGNLSSASVLHVLADTIAERPAGNGDLGLLIAMGPGFCCEMVLLRW
ncbi:3-oxoacyl-[acyl-carrier-protein] synthase III C-terminal domain-containing protein [Psychromarinibacter sp. C21-152]|uniref:3-oxoacyl-[acyl-carrier-protein] synthase III C-terminal domain-containing protein n=1 Tax=Psychromarinibacter sediminicola TaxID=3033385 RepID=A0AAE3TAX8_9RHOB|nr:3-oxoacyl-[acyl-carrier-protein] synthase III C-terminal domain-containing protein [Psychromarinibacter sediminicola]MDF0603712.1 3-oxoacyl-[acyl-carrier-protein] synthase III C-terminal domain-containing protein [Psychromarinibacter sediminicola]